jgi:hypothetical protein
LQGYATVFDFNRPGEGDLSLCIGYLDGQILEAFVALVRTPDVR